MMKKVSPQEKIKNNCWQHTQNENYLNIIKNRIEFINLAWVEQFVNFIKSEDSLECSSIKDIGCQTFQVYKQLKSYNPEIKYFGYELDQQYIDIGLKYFPELRESTTVGDFNSVKNPAITDWSVCSATLEHIDDWRDFLKKILETTKNTAYIRTFLGETTKRTECFQRGASSSYPIWQFSFQEFLSEIKLLGFNPYIELDSFTKSLPRLLDIDPVGVIRQTYIVIAKRNS